MAKFGFSRLWICCAGLLYACSDGGNLSDGAALTTQYCASCHLSPDPQWLDRQGWAALLPHLQEAVNYHDTLGMAESDLQQIVAYFQAKAPQKLVLPVPVTDSLPYFQADNFPEGAVPAVDALLFHPTRFRLFASAGPYLLSFDKNLKADTLLDAGHPIAHMLTLPTLQQGQARVLVNGGQQFTEVSLLPGKPVQALKWHVKGNPQGHQVQWGPVLQKDREDLLVMGGTELMVLSKSGQETAWEPEVAWNVADWEIIDAQTIDFQFDNLPDLLVLTAGSNPRLLLLEKMGNGGFQEKTLLQFPPVYAPSSMLVFDIDRDGLKDVLMTSGRADRNRPYDGLYIYRNMGDHFVENYFHHLPGALQIGVWDFDRDGYTEMVAIGRSEPGGQSFLYFDQNAPLKFDVKTLPLVAPKGFRSLVVGDYDTDGDTDIVLLHPPGGSDVLTVIGNLFF